MMGRVYYRSKVVVRTVSSISKPSFQIHLNDPPSLSSPHLHASSRYVPEFRMSVTQFHNFPLTQTFQPLISSSSFSNLIFTLAIQNPRNCKKSNANLCSEIDGMTGDIPALLIFLEVRPRCHHGTNRTNGDNIGARNRANSRARGI